MLLRLPFRMLDMRAHEEEHQERKSARHAVLRHRKVVTDQTSWQPIARLHFFCSLFFLTFLLAFSSLPEVACLSGA